MSLTRKQIKDYFSSKKARADFDAKVKNDPFVRDALEGWEKVKGNVDAEMSKIDAKLYPRTSWSPLLYVSVLAFLSVVSILYIYRPKDNYSFSANKTTDLKKVHSDKKTETQTSVSNLEKPKTILKNEPSKKTKNTSPVSTSSLDSVFTPPVFLPTYLSVRPIRPVDNNSKQKSKAIETYIQAFKVVDYRFYRKKTNEIAKNDLLTGTPANFEKTDSQENTESFNKEFYVNYLENSLVYLKNGQLDLANERFKKILETFPEDVNALFYGGYCSFQLKDFKTAEKRFSQLELCSFSNFDEEGEWYLLQTLKQIGDCHGFNRLKQRIDGKEHFYKNDIARLKCN
ncbi:MAG: hypothetical protein RL264_2195 [Bacteroidota bacterium]|jgi:TolA-binding protein